MGTPPGDEISTATLTPEQVAVELNVSAVSVRRWLADGRLEGVRLGAGPLARYRVRRSALDQFMRPATDERRSR